MATAKIETKTATLISIDSRQTQTVMEVVELTFQERAIRALKPLAAIWGVAIVFLLVPVIHFVVPPALLLVGLFVGLKVFVQPRLVREAQCQCPLCSKTIVIRDMVYYPETKIVCENCRNHLKLVFTD